MKIPLFKRRVSKQPASESENEQTPRLEEAGKPEEPPVEHPEALRQGALLARWYVLYRLEGELARARRYSRPLSVLIGEPVLLPGERVTAGESDAGATAAQAAARSTDLVGWLDEDRYIIVMPETVESDAEVAVFRWRNQMWLRSRHLGGRKWRIAAIENSVRYETAQQLIEAAGELTQSSAA